MRRSLMAMAAAAALASAAALAPTPAPAAAAAAAGPVAVSRFFNPVQFYGGGSYRGDDGWERRHQWRERQHEARIAEAARREAWRVEREREQRRAWRPAVRGQQHGHGPAYGYGSQRGW